ncbi:helix-turn-helix domain-containing protein [Aeromonas hydrophila]
MNKQYNPNRLKVARLRRKMTLKSLSECIGMSSKMVSAYESETSKYIPTIETLMDMASALGYPIEFFMVMTSKVWMHQQCPFVH